MLFCYWKNYVKMFYMSLWQCMGTQRYTGRYYKETLINDSDKVLSIVFTMILTLSTQKSRTPFPLAPSEISNPSHGHYSGPIPPISQKSPNWTTCFICHALGDLVLTVQFKNVKNIQGGVLLLACKFTKRNTPPWMFFTFFKLYKWYQIKQNITFRQTSQGFPEWMMGRNGASFLALSWWRLETDFYHVKTNLLICSANSVD